jgi:adenylate cyclase class 2
MYEVELKLRADHDTVRTALDGVGATLDRRVRQVDTYYDAPHREFAETDEALRLREERRERADDSDAPDVVDEGGVTDAETTTRLTYKGPLVDAESKTRAEHETAVADGDTAAGILAGLGFEPAAVVEKDRTFFGLDDYTVSLDTVDGLGEFVEVEGEAAGEDDVVAVREGAADVLRELGLDPDDQIRTSYLGLLLDIGE